MCFYQGQTALSFPPMDARDKPVSLETLKFDRQNSNKCGSQRENDREWQCISDAYGHVVCSRPCIFQCHAPEPGRGCDCGVKKAPDDTAEGLQFCQGLGMKDMKRIASLTCILRERWREGRGDKRSQSSSHCLCGVWTPHHTESTFWHTAHWSTCLNLRSNSSSTVRTFATVASEAIHCNEFCSEQQKLKALEMC